ncbi:hypothetical protein [Streptomyces sp. NPDC052721]|uniref:hypothetical protein n=1 Tax=Streptomyces sp. NPDC052721 TaxID=3154955 RepID=UPI00343BAE6C
MREPADEDGAHIVLTMAGTQVLPAVTDTCEKAAVPCVSTTSPWQAYVPARASTRPTASAGRITVRLRSLFGSDVPWLPVSLAGLLFRVVAPAGR